jgi:MFS family permease
VWLSQQGFLASTIGFFGMLPYIAILISLRSLSFFHQKLGVAYTVHLGLGLLLLSVLGIAIASHFLLLCKFALLLGLGSGLLWNTTEMVIAQNTPPSQLGRTTGLYQTILGASFAVGPFLPELFSLSFRAVTVAASGLTVLAFLPMVGLRNYSLPSVSSSTGGITSLKLLLLAPALVMGALAGGLFENGLNVMLPLQALSFGKSEGVAIMIAGVIAIGSLLTQYPVGWLADRTSSQRLLVGSLITLLLVSVLLPLANSSVVLFCLALVFGALGGGVYTLVMIRLGAEQREHVPVLTPLMVGAYSLGAVVGPFLGGWALELSPRFGLAGVLFTMSTLALMTALSFEHRRENS